MKTRTLILAAMLPAALFLTAGAASLLAAQKPSYINVTTTVHDYDTASPPNLLLMRSDNPNDGKATYSNTGSVTSRIFPSGGMWQLYIGNQSVRTIWLTLSHPVNGSKPAPAPDGSYYASTEVFSHCYNSSNQATGFLTIPPGMANNRCSLGVDFSYQRTKYRLVMNPAALPGTGWATVSCNGGDNSGACNSWTIVPNMTAIAGDGTVPTVANLYQFTHNGSLVYIGSYYNTYRIDVTNP